VLAGVSSCFWVAVSWGRASDVDGVFGLSMKISSSLSVIGMSGWSGIGVARYWACANKCIVSAICSGTGCWLTMKVSRSGVMSECEGRGIPVPCSWDITAPLAAACSRADGCASGSRSYDSRVRNV